MSTSFSAFSGRVSQLLKELSLTDSAGRRLSADDGLRRSTELLREARTQGKKVFVIANGGSAAIAAHLQTDLGLRRTGRVLTFQGGPLLTALSNDFGYEHAFEHMIGLWADPQDCLIAISSSGRSQNILNGVVAALNARCNVITLSGFKPDNPLRRLGQVNLYVESCSYGEVEVAHQALVHAVSDDLVQSFAPAVAVDA